MTAIGGRKKTTTNHFNHPPKATPRKSHQPPGRFYKIIRKEYQDNQEFTCNPIWELTSWNGYKLHLDFNDCGFPLSAVLTSASVHDSQAAIPLMKLTAGKVISCYDLMDAAYDAAQIWDMSRELGHVPIIDRNPRGKEIVPMAPHEAQRYTERTVAERGNGRLKDELGARYVQVRGPNKVMMHLMFGLLALFADRLLRFAGY